MNAPHSAHANPEKKLRNRPKPTQNPSPATPIGRILLLVVSVAFCLILSADGVGGQSADDHGNTFASATSLSLGSSGAGRIAPGDDTDVFKLDLSGAPGPTEVWVYATGGYDTVGGLYDSDASLLAFNDDGFLAGSLRAFSLRNNVPPGVYYIVVASYEREPGDYTVHAQAVTDPGSTTDTATPLNLDSPAGGTIDTAGDADYFRLDFAEPMHLIIEARSGNYAAINADLFDAHGTDVPANIYPLTVRIGLRFTHGFRILDDFGPGTYYIRVTGAIGASSRPVPYTIHAYEDIEYADYIEDCEARTRSSNNPLISDPLFACQWHLDSPDREGANTLSAWAKGVKGEGINVAVVDDGMDYRHGDLKDNVNTSLNHDYTGTGDIYDPFQHHGTHIAGIVASRDNAVGVRGVAPRATTYGYNLLAIPVFFNEADAMARNAVVTAVSNNSWGPLDGPGFSWANSFWEQAVETGLTTGYNGRGTFYVFSAGNGHLLGDDSNLDEYVNHYGVTAVCAVHSGGGRAGYSEMGANLWVCAPSNNRPEFVGGRTGILTTENSDRYVKDFGGTSASAPIVSGVAALLRSANPDLTWRDLKLILAASARKNDPSSSGWEGGASKYGSASGRYDFNHEYGFGVVDASAAVDLAKIWHSLPPLQDSTVGSDQLDVEIPDATDTGDSATVVSELTLGTGIGFTEFVEVIVAFEHDSFRDLEIELESPSGAISKLAVPFDTYNDYYNPFVDFVPLYSAFRFGSARHLGEDPNGVWKLRVADRIPVAGGMLASWSITVYGHERTPGPPTVNSVTSGAGSLAIAWSAPEQTAGLPVTGYDLRHIRTVANEAVDSNWTVMNNVWTAATGDDLEYAVPKLTGGVQYEVQVRAHNAWGPGEWSESASGIPENALPSFDSSSTIRFVPENSPAGTHVGNPVTATDDDTLTYTLGATDAASFEIGGATGQIAVGVGTELDFESDKNEYTVEVTATDLSLASDTITVTITVTDVDPGTPYDTNNDEVIDRSEALAAVTDYFSDLIDKDEVLRVLRLYFSS